MEKFNTVINTYIFVIVKAWCSFHSWEDDPFINGKPKFVWLKTHFSASESFSQSYSLAAVIVEGWFSFHSYEDTHLINGKPKVV